MHEADAQRGYWSSSGAVKTFSHPLDTDWLAGLGRAAQILDFGCGYGRLVQLLVECGYRNVEGVDISEGMIARAREQVPGGRFAVLPDPPRLPHDRDSVDAVLLFAVLTCIPTNLGQRRLATELHRVLRHGGLLYLSDLCLQDDERNQSRYQKFAATYGTYGVFRTDDGAVCRHHTMDWLLQLFAEFDLVQSREVPARTMNGRPVRATQLLLSKRTSAAERPR